MAKQLKLNYKDKEYTLEYTRRTVTELERRGFIADDVNKKPMTMLPLLFSGAFLAHHRLTPQKDIEEIYDHIPDKEGLISKLVDMYSESIAALVDDPKDAKGNVSWTANF